MEEVIQDISARLYRIATGQGPTYRVDNGNEADHQDGLSPHTAWQASCVRLIEVLCS